MPARTIGIVLAGGRSSRMGTDKAHIKWGNATLLRHMATILHDAGVDEVVVSGKAGGVSDYTKYSGPLMGIYSVASKLLGAPKMATRLNIVLVFVPVDMPMLSPKCVSRLIRSAAAYNVCHYKGFELPLAFRLSKSTVMALEELCRPVVGKKNSSIKTFLRVVSAHALDAGNLITQRQFANINTPQQLAQSLL